MNIDNQETNPMLWQMVNRLTRILKGKVDHRDSFLLTVVFTVLRRIDCYISEYTDDMSGKFVDINDMPVDYVREELTKMSHSSLYYNVSGLCFERLLAHPDNIDFYLMSYMEGFNPEVRDVLDKLGAKGLVSRLKYSNVLYDIVNFYASVDLGSNVASKDICNMLRNMMVRGEEFATPMLYCYFAIALLFGKEVKSDHVKIYDPVCGMGNLLNAVTFSAYSMYEDKKVSVYGQDVNQEAAAIMSACSMLIGDDPTNIKVGNVLTDDLHSDQTFEYIVADIPAGMPWHHISKEITDEMYKGRFPMGTPKMDSQLLFIQHIISKMSPSGSRAMIITNANPLSGGDICDSNIRKAILERDLIELIVALPPVRNGMPQRYMWILSNNKAEHRRGLIHLIDANMMKAKEAEYIGDDISLANVVSQWYDLDFPESYNKFVTMRDLGVYQVTIKDWMQGGLFTIDVPLAEDPMRYLAGRGISPENSRYEIKYERTIDLYKIDMDKIFFQKEELVSSEDLYDEMKQAISAVKQFESFLNSRPELRVNTDLREINEGIFTQVPSHWEGAFLRDCIICSYGRKYSESDCSENAIPVFSISDLRTMYSYPSSFTKDSCPVIMENGDVIIVARGSNVGDVLRGKDGALGQSMILVKANENMIHPRYLEFLFHALDLKSLATGNVIKNLSYKDIGNLFVCLPPMEEQERIANYLESLQDAIGDMEVILGTPISIFESYFQSVLTEVITGKYKL